MKESPESFRSQRYPATATLFIFLGVFCLAWTDAFARDLGTLSLCAFVVTLMIFLEIRDRRRRRRLGLESAIVPLDGSDRRAQMRLLGLFLLVAVGLLNPSHELVYVPATVVPKELQGYQKKEKDSRAYSFVSAFESREEVVKALPTTVDPERTALWGLQIFVALLTAVAVATWARHRPKVIRIACWFIFGHAILLSWVALSYRVEGAEDILGRFENANPRFYGPFRMHNFWVAWLVLSLGAGSALFADAIRKRAIPGIVLTLGGFVSLIPPILTSRSRSALVIVSLFLALSLLQALFRLPLFAKASRGKLVLAGLGAAAMAALILGIAVVSTWDQWATKENAKAQKMDRMGDTISQFAELREGRMPFIRPALARDGIKVGLMKPVYGWGFGSFEYAHPLIAGPEFTDDANQHETKYYGQMLRARHVHNDWVQFWAEAGTVGLILLLSTIWAFWSKNARATRGTVMEGGLLTGCACVMILALWDFPLNNFAVQCLFAACFGLAIAARRPSLSLARSLKSEEFS